LLGATHGAYGDIAFARGEFDRAARSQKTCLSTLEGVEPWESSRLLSFDVVAQALGRLGRIHWLQGRPDEAQRTATACLARAEAHGSPINRALALLYALMVEQFRRDEDAAQALTKSYLELSEEYGFYLPFPIVHAVSSRPLAQGGEYAAAVAQLEEGIAANFRLGVRQGSTHLLAFLAEMELWRGCAREGLVAIDKALALVEETGERFCEADIHRIRGELLWLDREGQPAEACFQTALDVARRQGALSLELRAATSLARLWNDTGHGQEARPLLAAVYGRFSEGFDTADLRDAKSLLDSL
jgi:adenylate cyclase